MNADQTTDHYIILNGDMPGELHAVGDDIITADMPIVGDMAVVHKEVIVADPCGHAAPRRAAVEGGKFSHGIVIAEDEFALFPGVLQVLWGSAQGRVRIDVGVMPKGCLLYTSPSPRDSMTSRMPSSA